MCCSRDTWKSFRTPALKFDTCALQGAVRLMLRTGVWHPAAEEHYRPSSCGYFNPNRDKSLVLTFSDSKVIWRWRWTSAALCWWHSDQMLFLCLIFRIFRKIKTSISEWDAVSWKYFRIKASLNTQFETGSTEVAWSTSIKIFKIIVIIFQSDRKVKGQLNLRAHVNEKHLCGAFKHQHWTRFPLAFSQKRSPLTNQ